ncbi:MAG TPA: SprT family zinc-dependent metalloprotease [Candidatus Limnocylindrales bacterium]|nr:SprT family zinc-dependent metalloprotease [Candidatus Limnocylindrales bacterium]
MEEAARSVILDGRRIGYTLRRNPRSRGLRAVIDPDRGLLISVPPPRRRGWAAPEPLVERFLGDRRAWVVRHLDRLERQRAAQRARGGARDGGSVRYLGEPHRVRVLAASPTIRRSTVERTGADDGDELTIRLGGPDRRQPERVLEAWLRERARAAIERALARHAAALGVAPSSVHVRDPRTRWGSASKEGRLMFSWRLILAPPDALETVVVHELAHLRVFGHGPRFWTLVAGRRPGHLADRAWLRRHSHELHAALETAPAAEAGTAIG